MVGDVDNFRGSAKLTLIMRRIGRERSVSFERRIISASSFTVRPERPPKHVVLILYGCIAAVVKVTSFGFV